MINEQNLLKFRRIILSGVLIFISVIFIRCSDTGEDPNYYMPRNVAILINDGADASADTVLLVEIYGTNIFRMQTSTD